MKYFLANRVPGEKGITLRGLLRVAFGRWSIERCFRVAKDELGMDHYQVRGWRCLHRHFYLTQASYLFCARIRQQYDTSDGQADRLTIEQVRSAMSTWLVGRRPRTRLPSQATRERPKPTTLSPATQPASREVPHQDENRPLDRDGHRRRADQIMYNPTCGLTTYGVSRLTIAARKCVKVALPN